MLTFFRRLIIVAALGPTLLYGAEHCGPTVRIGSKGFTESVLLGEVVAQLARASGASAEMRRGLGGTRLVWNALRSGEIDIYPEYTGTLLQELLTGVTLTGHQSLREALQSLGLAISEPLGFDNTYVLGVTAATATRLELHRISDLRRHPELQLGFSHEFLDRPDGWTGLRRHYALPQQHVRGLDHDLAYRGLQTGDIQVTDLYATDAEIAYYNLHPLADDRGYFPAYQAVFVYRQELARCVPALLATLRQLAGSLDAATMATMNAAVKLHRQTETEVAAAFLQRHFGTVAPTVASTSDAQQLWRYTVEHLTLVAISLSAAIAVALPLGIAAHLWPRVGHWLLAGVAVIQTIPALALFVFMIPLLGIGAAPAIAALFFYSLLPIMRNTYTGLQALSPVLRESAEALGLPVRARLWRVELPLATPFILTGIKTSAVINVGAATLGALIGAGGYGEPILTGIRLDDTRLILSGAVPSALLALAVQGLFELAERRAVPRGLRITPQHRR